MLWLITLLLVIPMAAIAKGPSQEEGPGLGGMRWRLIGPFRAGRVTAVCGVPSQPDTYYIGTPGGGVWKTNDSGRVWKPIFDQEHVASIGALAVPASSPNTVYVATGEQTAGNGIYKSTDAGATWKHVGLENSGIITSLLVDPHNADVVLAGVQGNLPSGVNRGVYKSTDGGSTWTKVLFKDQTTGVMDMNWAMDTPSTVYAALWQVGAGRGAPVKTGPDASIYKSTDEGFTWQLSGVTGLPNANLGRIGVAVAPGTGGKRVYAIMNQGLYRSDDGGATWQQSTKDPRVVGSWYFSRAFVDPTNANNVYVSQTSMYRSTDAGKTFESYQGAPSGDDYHVLWIDPGNSKHIIMGVDQGAVISVNGGETWSDWYNQPTGQFYHVSTDSRFPYRVYAAQQDSGTTAVISRSDYGEITFRDWFSVAGFEACFIVPDPGNPNTIFAGGWYGSVVRFDRSTGQYAHVFVAGSKYRTNWDTPLVLSPQDPHTIYFGTQYVLKTTDEGVTWSEISPDLAEISQNEKKRPGVLTVLAPSSAAAGEMWAGANTGVVQLTRNNGATWSRVSPPNVEGGGMIEMIEASPFDAGAAYVTVVPFMGSKPRIFRTHDFGKNWQETITGLPGDAVARVVREDPARKGLLYAGTETGVYFSFDDGDHWQSLQLNLPTSSVRDLTVHGDDLVAATYGRALWVLDDVSALRQMTGATVDDNGLYKPSAAVRVRWDENQDTPLQAETPAGNNPPDGAVIYYNLKSAPEGEIKLAVYDKKGDLVRSFSSIPEAESLPPGNAPEYWFAPPEALTKQAGLNRFVWDLHYRHPDTLPYGYYGFLLDYTEYTLPDHAIPGETPRDQPEGPLVAPGEYEIALTVDGKTYRQPLIVKPDPRVHVSQADFDAQLELARQIVSEMGITDKTFRQVADLVKNLSDRRKSLESKGATKADLDSVDALLKKLGELETGAKSVAGLGPMNRDLGRILTMVESADIRPTQTASAAAGELCADLNKALGMLRQVNGSDVAAVNAILAKYGVDQVHGLAGIPSDAPCGK